MKLVFDKMKGEPSYAAGARYIEEMIRSGQLMNGDRLPSIREFADDNDMSTATAQRIYSEIEQKGLITTIQGSGSLVTFNEDVVLDDGINNVTVFWSYAHKDDLNSKGAILTLLEAIKAEYELQTGEDLTVFVDKDGIEWGANWKNAINEALLNTVIFIPILTPTYLKRPSCLGELRNAVSVFREKKIAYGIFPIRFTNVDAALRTFQMTILPTRLVKLKHLIFMKLGLEIQNLASTKIMSQLLWQNLWKWTNGFVRVI